MLDVLRLLFAIALGIEHAIRSLLAQIEAARDFVFDVATMRAFAPRGAA